MPWFKVDDGFHGHPKVMDLSLSAVGLWTLAGSWCAKYLTDGFVPEKTLPRLGAERDQASELFEAGLWEEAEGGWQFKDWIDYQPLKEDVEAEREAARERMKKVRAAKKGVKPPRSGEQGANDDRSSEEVPLAPSQSLSQSPPDPLKSVTAADESKPPRKRGTRIPEPFIVTAEMRAWAAKETPSLDVDDVTRRFVNYWRAATRNAAKLDWRATWENWLLKDNDQKPRPSKDDQALAVLAMGARLQQQEIEQ